MDSSQFALLGYPQFQERPEQAFASDADVIHKLKEAPGQSGSFSCEMPRWGHNHERSKDQSPSVVLTGTSWQPLLLPCRLGGISTLLRELERTTVWVTAPVWPAQPTNGFITLDLIEQILKVDRGNPGQDA